MKFKAIGIFLLSVFALCSCTPGTIDVPLEEPLPSNAVVSGIYLIEEGFQSFNYEGEEEERTDFTSADGIQIPVDQSGNAVKFFTCMGMLEEDLIVRCVMKEELNGGAGCQVNTGTLTFGEDTLVVDVHFDFDDLYYGKGYSDIELVMTKVRDVCEKTGGGS